MDLFRKLEILAGAAKYDASCASSGSYRKSKKGIGSTSISGICHSWSDDGRCISLLKVLFSNFCIYDCAYCINRRSNDIPRASFTVEELVDLTIEFYKRNYIEGLFLSSGIFHSADTTLEKLVAVVRKLRLERDFNGYIHLKVMPGASKELLYEAGLYVDRLSVNIELPSEKSLKLVAPDKDKESILKPMGEIHRKIFENRLERKSSKKVPIFTPGGQSTQLIIGATPEDDLQILNLSYYLYKKFNLKRVYYSAYVSVNDDSRLIYTEKPDLIREHRLYQADWLIRVYGFDIGELNFLKNGRLSKDFDPKVEWALNNIHLFPMEINTADYNDLIRIPGIGLKSAYKIIHARRYKSLDFEDLQKMGVVLKRAKYFITCKGRRYPSNKLEPDYIKLKLLKDNEKNAKAVQLSLL